MEAYTLVLEAKCDDCGAEACWQSESGFGESRRLFAVLNRDMRAGHWGRRGDKILCPHCLAKCGDQADSQRPRCKSGLTDDEADRLSSGKVTPIGLAKERGVTRARIYQVLERHFGCPYSEVCVRRCVDCNEPMPGVKYGRYARCRRCGMASRRERLLTGRCDCGNKTHPLSRFCRECFFKKRTRYDRDVFVRLYQKIPSAASLGRYLGMSAAMPYKILDAVGVPTSGSNDYYSDEQIESALQEIRNEGVVIPDLFLANVRVRPRSGTEFGTGAASGGPGDGP